MRLCAATSAPNRSRSAARSRETFLQASVVSFRPAAVCTATSKRPAWWLTRTPPSAAAPKSRRRASSLLRANDHYLFAIRLVFQIKVETLLHSEQAFFLEISSCHRFSLNTRSVIEVSELGAGGCQSVDHAG